jgi:hypothetical protein
VVGMSRNAAVATPCDMLGTGRGAASISPNVGPSI